MQLFRGVNTPHVFGADTRTCTKTQSPKDCFPAAPSTSTCLAAVLANRGRTRFTATTPAVFAQQANTLLVAKIREQKHQVEMNFDSQDHQLTQREFRASPTKGPSELACAIVLLEKCPVRAVTRR